MKVAVAGGTEAVTLASGQGNPTSIVVYGTNVYWAGSSTDLGGMLSTVATAGGESPRTLAVGIWVGSNIVTSSDGIYWIGGVTGVATPGGLMRLSFSGGAPNTVVPGIGGSQLVLDADNAYWTDATVSKAALDGKSPPVTLANTGTTAPGFSTPLVVDATSVYFVANTIGPGANPSLSGYTILKVPK
jgi:hypothetical protein